LSADFCFDRRQSVFDLPQWRWQDLPTYNGFTSAERIRGWQLFKFYEINGWVKPNEACSITGARSDVVWHDEDYFRPWLPYSISRRSHQLLHMRFRRPDLWEKFLAEMALPVGWFRQLSLNAVDVATERRASGEGSPECIVAAAPHPSWVHVPLDQFKR